MTHSERQLALILAEVLAHENAALRALDFPAAAALLPHKIAAVAALTVTSTADRDIVEQLAALAADNRALLERAILVQTRVLGTIARAASRQIPATDGAYGRTAACDRPRPVAISARY